MVGPTLSRAEPQSGSAQPPNELPAVDFLGASRNHPVAVLLWYVVVVALEPAPWNPHSCSERVQLGQRFVRYQVAPTATAPPPPRLVDEHGHVAQPVTGVRGDGMPARCLVAPRPPPGDTDQR